jgi:hypothetical protein
VTGTPSARVLRLVRTEPGQGAAQPTGTVAEAAVFSDGTAVLHWLTDPGGTEFYASEQAMRGVRESSGRSRFTEPGIIPDMEAMLRVLRDAGEGGLTAMDLRASMEEAGLPVRRETLTRWLAVADSLSRVRRVPAHGVPVWVATGRQS